MELDEHTFYRLTEKLTLSLIEKNQIYHKILSIIESADPKQAANEILITISQILEDKKISMVSASIDKAEGKTGGIFRRIG